MSKFDLKSVTDDFAVPRQDMEEIYEIENNCRHQPTKQFVVCDENGSPIGCGYIPDIVYREWKRGNLNDITDDYRITVPNDKISIVDGKYYAEYKGKTYQAINLNSDSSETTRLTVRMSVFNKPEDIKRLFNEFYCGASQGYIVRGKYKVRPATEDEIKWCANKLHKGKEENQFVIDEASRTMLGKNVLDASGKTEKNVEIPSFLRSESAFLEMCKKIYDVIKQTTI